MTAPAGAADSVEKTGVTAGANVHLCEFRIMRGRVLSCDASFCGVAVGPLWGRRLGRRTP